MTLIDTLYLISSPGSNCLKHSIEAPASSRKKTWLKRMGTIRVVLYLGDVQNLYMLQRHRKKAIGLVLFTKILLLKIPKTCSLCNPDRERKDKRLHGLTIYACMRTSPLDKFASERFAGSIWKIGMRHSV